MDIEDLPEVPEVVRDARVQSESAATAVAAIRRSTARLPRASLDAIHLAGAGALGAALAEVVTYDRRMAEGAHALGLPVSAPA